ncbi:MAG: AAA family ATPase [Actinomycetia bacterium]|nr:AAA family ATPase [Actinomycetes bacterium]
MIHLVEIENWRAYDKVAIDLGASVVFFVAPNGIGKSSLVEATRWALLGAPPARHATRAVRHGTNQATVTVEFSTPDQQMVRVMRTLTASGRSTLSVRVGDDELSEDDYVELLRSLWGADPGLIDNLMFTDPAAPAAKSAFAVREHLAGVLGVTPLLDAADQLVARRKDAERAVADARTDIVTLENRLAELTDSATDTAGTLEAAISERDRLSELIETEQGRVDLAQQWAQYRAAVETHNGSQAAVLAELAAFIEVDPSAPHDGLRAATEEAEVALASANETRTQDEVRAARAASAADVLANATDVCPTCLRPLAEHERSAALAQHGDTIEDAADTGAIDAAVAEADTRVARLRDFANQLAALQPPTSPADPDPGPEAAETLEALRQAQLDTVAQIGALQSQANSEQARRIVVDDLDAARDRLNKAASEELMLDTTITVLNNLADRTLTDRIDPLIAELSARWKTVFGADGLTLEPSGELSVHGPAGTLGVADLSGGERATALLIARLLITSATTRIPTVWFDEPLEHLDPRRRAAVAKTLVRAGQTRTVDQLIVTTYEDRIARQLAAADPIGVRIVHADKPRPA